MKVRLKILKKDGDVDKTIGPFNDERLYNWIREKYESEDGKRELTREEAEALCSDLYPLLSEIEIPQEIDDINSTSALNSLSSISQICLGLLTIKPKNRRLKGYEIRWG